MAEYYVATTGNDSTGDGSIGSPWQTIQYGVNQLSAGDTLYIRGGTYTETVSIGTTGTSGSPVTVQAYDDETVVIDGEDTRPSSWGYIVILTGEYITLDNIEVKNSAWLGIGLTGSNNTVSNCYVHHCYDGGILINADHCIVENCEAYWNSTKREYGEGSGYWSWGISATNASYAIIRNNTVHSNWGEGIGPFECDNLTVEDNTIYDSYSGNLYVNNVDTATIQRNTIYGVPGGDVDSAGHSSTGISLADESSPTLRNITVINNVIYDTNWYGIYFWLGASGSGLEDCLIAHNTVVTSDRGVYALAIASGDHSNTRICNNIFTESSTVDDAGLTFDHNFWMDGAPSNGSGTGDIGSSGDPDFVDRTNDNYDIGANSDAIDAGADLSGTVSDDHDGASRPYNTDYDMGAYEYGASTTTTTSTTTTSTTSTSTTSTTTTSTTSTTTTSTTSTSTTSTTTTTSTSTTTLYLFNVDFETGDFSQVDATEDAGNSSYMGVDDSDPLLGNYSYWIDPNAGPTDPIYVEQVFTTTSRIRTRFYFKPNSMATGTSIPARLLTIVRHDGWINAWVGILERDGDDDYDLSLYDGVNSISLGSVRIIDHEHFIEVDYRAALDGHLKLWVDDVSGDPDIDQGIGNLHAEGYTVDKLRLGKVNNGPEDGPFYYDEWAANTSGEPIGGLAGTTTSTTTTTTTTTTTSTTTTTLPYQVDDLEWDWGSTTTTTTTTTTTSTTTTSTTTTSTTTTSTTSTTTSTTTTTTTSTTTTSTTSTTTTSTTSTSTTSTTTTSTTSTSTTTTLASGVLFNITHEYGTATDWWDTVHENGSGTATINATSALGGTSQGLHITGDGSLGEDAYVEKLLSGVGGRLRWRLYIDTDNVSNSNDFIISDIGTASDKDYLLRITTNNDSFNEFRVEVWEDDNSYRLSNVSVELPDFFEVYFKRPTTTDSEDGVFELYMHDTLLLSYSDLDNYNRFEDSDRLRIGGNTRFGGDAYIDEVKANNTGDYIGPVGSGTTTTTTTTSTTTTSTTTVTTTTLAPGYFRINVSDSPSGNQLFVAGDILRMKSFDGSNVLDNWLSVQSVESGESGYHTYVVNNESGSTGTFPAGTAVVNYGQSGDGYIMLTSDMPNAPYIDMATHTGTPWDTVTPHVRIGNLNGVLGKSSDEWGMAAGEDLSDTSKPHVVVSNSSFLIASSASGARIQINANRIAGYNSSDNLTFYLQSSNGKAYCGGGNVVLDEDGITISRGDSTTNYIKWVDDSDITRGYVYGSITEGGLMMGANSTGPPDDEEIYIHLDPASHSMVVNTDSAKLDEVFFSVRGEGSFTNGISLGEPGTSRNHYGTVRMIDRPSDPPEPPDGWGVIWISDGTEKGDAGDVMIAVQSESTTKYGTLFDHSSGTDW